MADRSVIIAHEGDRDHPYPTEQRIIGIELRLVSPYGDREEIALIPCDVRVPLSPISGSLSINATIHTSRGDTNFPVDARLP